MSRNVGFGGVLKILVLLAVIVVGSIKINSINFKSYSDMLARDELDEAQTQTPESIRTPSKTGNAQTPSVTAFPEATPETTGHVSQKPSETFAAPSPMPTAQPSPSPTPDVIESDDVVVQPGEAFIDFSSAGLGHIYCAFNTKKYTLLMTEHNGVIEYTDIKHDGTLERVSLTMGSGNYSVVIYENVSGNSFRTIEAASFTAMIENEHMPYLLPTTMVYYESSMQCIQTASWLAANESTPEDKAEAIYRWVVENVDYDFDIYGTLEAGYIPDAEYTFLNKRGICYDFAVLFAAMCRSQQIPCKVAHGYSDNVTGFHAWNEVYFGGQYHIVDTSTDSQIDQLPFVRQEGYYPEKYS